MPALILYGLTDRGDVAFWDTAEMQTVPWIAGIAHPTGFPLFVMGGWLFSHVLPLGSVAWRVSFFSSLAVVGAAWFLFRIVDDETEMPWLAAGVALGFETAHTVWSRATRAEVHDLALLFTAAAIFYGLRFYRTAGRADFIRSIAAAGCGLAVHPVAIFVVPGLLVLTVARRSRLDARTCAAALGAGALALTAYAYLPIRSAAVTRARLDPTLQLGLAPGSPFWDYGHPADPKGFWWLVTGAQFRTGEGFAGYANPSALLNALHGAAAYLQAELGIVASILAAAGIIALFRRDAVLGAAWALFALASVPFAFAYAQEADPQRYLLTLELVVMALAGVGFAALAVFASRVRRLPRSFWAVAGPALFVALALRHADRNRGIVAVNRDSLGRRFLGSVVALSPPRTIVVADWTYATALAYGAYVDGTLGDRFVVASRLPDAGSLVLHWSASHCVLVVADSRHPDFAGSAVRTRPLNATVPYIFAVDAGRGRRCEPKGT